MAGIIKSIFALILIGTSGWYYMWKLDQMEKYVVEEEVSLQEEPTKEPEILFGIVVDDKYVESGKIRRNENIADILVNHNVDGLKIYELAKASRKVFDVRRIMANQPYILICDQDSAHTAQTLIYEPNDIDYVVYNLKDSVQVELRQRPVRILEKESGGIISNSLYETMQEFGLPPQLTNDFADIFGWQIDFFHLYPGDEYKVIYEDKEVDGKSVAIGKILGAEFIHDGKKYYAVYYDQGDGVDYFDEQGNSLRKELLKYPVEFTRISSRYSGRRFHPVQKVWKAHLGTDFAAPIGTPIRSVGDGVVLEAGYGQYNGNYVKIKHNGIISTQYLHMSRIARGIRPGVHVKQGQTIGYVGMTGLANGPHVCYRFWKNGVQVNALKVEIPPSEPIKKENLADYDIARDQTIERLKGVKVQNAELLAGGL